MRHLKAIFTFWLVALVLASGMAPALAQSTAEPIPERRVELSENTDFYGSDLRNVFDVTFKDCLAVCLNDAACKAFTYNQKSSACFPKSAVGERTGFEGALSVEVFDAPAAKMAHARAQHAALSFLPRFMKTKALQIARRNGEYYPTNGWTYELLMEEARKAEQQKRPVRAMELMLAALNDSDRAEAWIEVARVAHYAKGRDSRGRNLIREMGVPAAINGFLRAKEPAQQVNALLELAKALEKAREGRRMIPTLRLAAELSNRKDVETALERAIRLHGFRITDHRVDHNAAQPRVCAEFSETLVKGQVEYSDFVQSDIPGLVAEADGRQLCLAGMAHGETVKVTFRQGLPAKNGEVLIRSVDLSVYVQDRDPTARFAGRAYVLPKRDGATVPLITVNLDQVDVAIYRIGDRNLLRSIQEDVFAKPVSRWDIGFLSRDLGQAVWTGTADVARELNREVTTALPIGDALTRFEPGVYALTARVPGGEEDTIATQWFVVSDIGISTMQGNDGVHVFAKSLETAGPLSGATVRMISKSNVVLATATTDEQGYARFAAGLSLGTGGSAPALVTVETEAGDYAFLDQGAAEYDLTDRGVEGRPAPPPIDVFLATDRGAYRPGETVHATVLARDHQAIALSGVPLTLELIRPDGVRFARQLVQAAGAGGGAQSLELPPNAARGSWKLRVLADRDAPPLVEQRLLVEDFVPEKIDFDLTLDKGPFRLTDAPLLGIDARYLFGAVGADLDVEGEVKLSAARELDGFAGYRFGLADATFPTRYESISATRTDATGRAQLRLKLPRAEGDAKPLEMQAVVRLRDGSGRPVERRAKATVLPGVPMIGIKPLFEGNVAQGSEAGFELVAVDGAGQRMDMPDVEWVLNRLHTRYQWYQQYGSWSYEPITRRERVASGTVTLSSSDVARLGASVDYGAYELKLVHKGAVFSASSRRFYAGWYASGGADDTPDLLEVAMDRASYGPGQTATLRIQSRFDGVAQVSVLSDRLIETRAVPLSKGANEVRFTVSQDWGAGAYVTASAIQPMSASDRRNPSRALGLAYAHVDPGSKLLNARFENPAEAQPNGPLDVVLDVAGLAPGQSGFVTIAAVDVGVLNLTGFKTPSPDGHYLGQRKLGVELRDVYGRLIDGSGAAGRLRSGGDGQSQAGLEGPPPAEEVLARFSGVLQAGEDGKVRTHFDLPDFNGTVRLMAVVWSEGGIGHAEQDVLVRDPVVVAAHAPRFLTPGDSSRIRVELTHAFGPTGDFEITLGSTLGLELAQSGTRVVTLSEGGRAVLIVPVTAAFPGASRFEAFVKTPDGRVLSKSITIGVQWNDPEISRQTQVELAAGSTLRLDGNGIAGFHPGTARATLAVGPLARFDAAGLMTALDRYPYGCTEQITSKAMPLLYFDQLSSALGLGSRAKVAERIEQSITRVLSNQASNGAFGLWRPSSGDLWLDSYVTDFLSRARALGHEVPDQAFEQALNNLRNRVNYAGDFERGGEDVAYALMVLAREGYAAIGDLRYYADTRSGAFATALAQAQLGSALASYGDQGRADRMFRLAGARVAQQAASAHWRADYGSALRDSAAVLTLAVDAGSEAVDRVALADRIARAPVRRRSTQENMWSLMAVNALVQQGAGQDIHMNGALLSAPMVRSLSEAQITEGVVVENRGTTPTTAVVTTFGVPSEPEPAAGTGYKIERFYYTQEGEAVTLEAVEQNARLVAVLRITPLRDTQARLMVDDPLPAGLEIDNPNLILGGDIKALDWLELNADVRFSEFRSDRFLAAVDWSGRSSFQLAYMVRAVSPGEFHHPAAVVEDMYRPDFRARTGVGRVVIAAR